MSRLSLVDPKSATGRTKELLDGVQKKLGVVPNMVKALANSPAALDSYVSLSGALSGAALSAKTRELVALAIGELNDCKYCVAAHSLIGSKVGLADGEILSARRGVAEDPKTAAILTFARELVVRRGEVRDDHLRNVRQAGVTEGEVAEIVATVALNVFTNWFNHVADPPIDFPVAKPLDLASAHGKGEGCGCSAES